MVKPELGLTQLLKNNPNFLNFLQGEQPHAFKFLAISCVKTE